MTLYDMRLDPPSKASEDCYLLKQHVFKYMDDNGFMPVDDLRTFHFCLDPITDKIIVRTADPRAIDLGGKLVTMPNEGETFDFCLRASPMHNNYGKRYPSTDLVRWLTKHLVGVTKHFHRDKWTYCGRGGGFSVPDVVYVGRLTADDTAALADGLRNGIGKHKAFGYGLLQLFAV